MITAIVPVTKMAGRLQNLENWLVDADDLGMEVILVHDYRDHETQTQLEAICVNFPNSRISLHSGKFGSPGAARNFGLKQSTSKYVVFWDSDDLPKPQGLVGEVARRDGAFDILVGQYLIKHKQAKSSDSRKSSDYDLNAIAYSPGLWRMVFLKKQINDIEFDNMKMGEDQVFLGKCLKRAQKICFTETLFYEYFLEIEGQLTGSRNSRLELGDAFDEAVKLRRKTGGNQYQFLSIVLARMSLSLVKINLHETFRPGVMKKFFRSEILFPRHPVIQLKSIVYVCLRLIGAK